MSAKQNKISIFGAGVIGRCKVVF